MGLKMKHLLTYDEKIKLDIKVGDILYGGRFKNKKTVVKKIGKDKKNQVTVNDKPLLKYRIGKTMPKKESLLEYSINDFDLNINMTYDDVGGDETIGKNDIQEKYDEFIKLYKSHIVDGKIKIYRNIFLSDDWFDKLQDGKIKRLGNNWSYSLESAESWDSEYGRDQKKEYFLVSTIKEEYVDWQNTFELFLIVPWETEVKLHKNTDITLDKILDKNYNQIKIYNIKKITGLKT